MNTTDNVIQFKPKAAEPVTPTLAFTPDQIAPIAACLCDVFGAFGGTCGLAEDRAEIWIMTSDGPLTVTLRRD